MSGKLTYDAVKVLRDLQLTDSERNVLAGGYCPKCSRPIRGEFHPAQGMAFLAPEIYASLRDDGIEVDTGHRKECELKGLRLP